jgi:thioredoxin-like negative regulator of GroEL
MVSLRCFIVLCCAGIAPHRYESLRADDPAATMQPTTGVAWHSDLRAAHRIAVEQQRPLLIVVGAEWCGPCHRLDRETFLHEELSRYINTYFVPVHLDYDRDREVIELLEIESVPTSIVLSQRAELLGRFTGFREPVPYYQELYRAQEAQLRLLESQAAQVAPQPQP